MTFQENYAAAIAKRHDQSTEITKIEESRDRWKARAEELQAEVRALRAGAESEPPPPDLTDDVATLRTELAIARKTIERQDQALEAARQRSRERQGVEAELAATKDERAHLEAKTIILKAECEGHRASRAKVLEIIGGALTKAKMIEAVRKAII